MKHFNLALRPSLQRKGIFAVLVLAFAVDCFSQSLAELARKERARQKSVQSKVVIVSGSGAAPAAAIRSTAAAPATAPATSATKPGEVVDNKGRNEKFWRGAFLGARDDIKRAESRVELLDLKLKDLNTQLLRQSDTYNREGRLGPEITATQKDLEDARKESEQSKKKVTDLEEELRKSGGPAGWAR